MAKQTAKTPDEGFQRLKADLKNGEFQNFYIFCGEEAYLREHYLHLLTGKLTGGPAGTFNEHRFSAETLTPEAFSEALEAMPMMAERTFIRVDDVDLFKLPEAQRTQYTGLLSDIPDYCCVVLTYDTVEFKINGTMKSSPRPSKRTPASSNSSVRASGSLPRGSRGISVPPERTSRTSCAAI